jgi:hypothetical protein
MATGARIARPRYPLEPYSIVAAWAEALTLARSKSDVSGIVHLLEEADAMPTKALREFAELLNEWKPKRKGRKGIGRIREEQLADARFFMSSRKSFLGPDGKLKRHGQEKTRLRGSGSAQEAIDKRLGTTVHRSTKQVRDIAAKLQKAGLARRAPRKA